MPLLCALSRRLPAQIARFMDRTPRDKPMRETTMTDILTGALIGAGRGCIAVDYPNETTTGADMEWWFVRPDGHCLCLLIQAKRAYEFKRTANAQYAELFYPENKGTQLKTLLACANGVRGIVPMYALYNPQGLIDAFRGIHPKAGRLKGITLVHARHVNRLFRAGDRQKGRRVSSLLPYMHPLCSVLCRSSSVGASRPAPAPLASSMLMEFMDGSGARRKFEFNPFPMPDPGMIAAVLRGQIQGDGDDSDDDDVGDSMFELRERAPAYVRRLLSEAVDEAGAKEDEEPRASRVIAFRSGEAPWSAVDLHDLGWLGAERSEGIDRE